MINIVYMFIDCSLILSGDLLVHIVTSRIFTKYGRVSQFLEQITSCCVQLYVSSIILPEEL